MAIPRLREESKSEDINRWLEAEKAYCMSGRLPEHGDPQNFVLVSTLAAAQAPLAGMICDSNEMPLILRARNLVLRGDLAEAEQVCTEGLASAVSPVERAEYLLELANVCARTGRFSEVLERVDAGLKSGPIFTTRMSLLGNGALASIQAGEFGRGLQYIQQTESMNGLIDRTNSRVFIPGYKTQLLARTQGTEFARAFMRREFAALAEQSEVRSNMNFIISYLLADADLRRLEGRCSVEPQLAALMMRRAMGDGVHEGLSVLCLHHSGVKEVADFFMPEVDFYTKNFQRCYDLHSQILGSREIACDMAATIREHKAKRQAMADQVNYKYRHWKEIKTVYIEPLSVYVHLKEKKIVPVCQESDQNTLLLRSLDQGPLSKSDLFEKVWGYNFNPEIHDGALRATLSRMRKRYNIDLLTDRGNVSLEAVWSVW